MLAIKLLILSGIDIDFRSKPFIFNDLIVLRRDGDMASGYKGSWNYCEDFSPHVFGVSTFACIVGMGRFSVPKKPGLGVISTEA